jgi:hypothetical protein
LSDVQFTALAAALQGGGPAHARAIANDIEDHRIWQRLTSLSEFRGNASDFHMAHYWILSVERDLRAIGLQENQWSLACIRKMSLDSPASLWAELIGRFNAPTWIAWKES